MWRVTLKGGSFRVSARDERAARGEAIALIQQTDDALHVTRINEDDPIEQLESPVDVYESMQVMRALMKAMLVRLGGSVELAPDELVAAGGLNVYFDGTTDPIQLRVVEGDPPETPTFANPDALPPS